MTPAIINLIAPSYYRRARKEGEDEIDAIMREYACNKGDAEEIKKTMTMLSYGCYQVMRDAAHTQKSEKEAADHFFTITFPELSDEAKSEITRYASWCVAKG